MRGFAVGTVLEYITLRGRR